MNLDLSDEETAALANELDDVTRNDRYPFAERIRTLKAILARLQTRAGPRALAGHRRCMRHRKQRPPKGDGAISCRSGAPAL